MRTKYYSRIKTELHGKIDRSFGGRSRLARSFAVIASVIVLLVWPCVFAVVAGLLFVLLHKNVSDLVYGIIAIAWVILVGSLVWIRVKGLRLTYKNSRVVDCDMLSLSLAFVTTGVVGIVVFFL